MNLKALISDHRLTHFRIFATVGAVGLLCFFLLTARGDTANTTETSHSLTADSPPSETSVSNITAAPETLLPASELGTSAPDANVPLNALADSMPEILLTNPIISTEGPTGVTMIGILSDSSPLPVIEGTAPAFEPSVLGLAEPGEQLLNKPLPWAEVSLDWGHLLVQFFAPCPNPLPPGGRPQPDWDESDRPWPVMAAGAATGNSWNEPGTYQAQGFLSFCW